jgi:hypothetical protein
MLPYFYLTILLVAIFLCSIIAIKQYGGMDKVKRYVHVLFIFIVAFVFPGAAVLQGSGVTCMRVTYPAASLLGVLLADMYVNHPEVSGNDKLPKRINIAVSLILVFLLAGQYFGFQRVFISKYQVNYTDMVRAEFVGQEIAEYQEKTGIEVTKIAFYEDADMDVPTYRGQYWSHAGNVVESSFTTGWSDLNSINYYLNADYERAECDEEYAECFAETDWHSLSSEQLIFDGDTLHLCVY